MKRRLYKIHKWCGLIAGFFIFLMGLSGAILVFHYDIEQAEHKDVWQIGNSEPVSVDRAYQKVNSRFPNSQIRAIRFSNNREETLTFSVKSENDRFLVFAHPSNGTILQIVGADSTLRHQLLNLHYSFFAGSLGKLLVFVVGLVFLCSLVTGIIIYRKAVIKVILFKSRLNRKTRSGFYASLHHYVGVWALILNLILVLTGTLIAFDNLGHGSSPKGVIPLARASVDSAIRAINKTYPDFTPSYIRYPVTKDGAIEINGKIKDAPFYWTQYYNKITVNSNNGEISSLQLTSQAGIGKKIASIVGVIHMVEFDNYLWKVLFCLAGLSAPVLSITGFFMWKLKRNRL